MTIIAEEVKKRSPLSVIPLILYSHYVQISLYFLYYNAIAFIFSELKIDFLSILL